MISTLMMTMTAVCALHLVSACLYQLDFYWASQLPQIISDSIAEVNISPKINISAQPLKKALQKTPEAQKLGTEVNIST